MENIEIRLFDLIETKTFEELNAEELAFVLEHLTESEYRMHREIIDESSVLNYPMPVPLPLAVPEKKVVFFRRTVPLYQALLAAGCIAFLVYILRPAELQTVTRYAQTEKPALDTMKAGVTIHDTVIKFVEVIRYQEKLMRDTISIVQSVFAPKETRMLEAGNSFPLPSIRPLNREMTGNSLSDDKTVAFLPKAVNSGVFDFSK